MKYLRLYMHDNCIISPVNVKRRTMQYGSKCNRLITFVLTLSSMVLQLICLSTPGWLIQIQGPMESHRGIFYIRKCWTSSRGECESKTMLDIYRDNLKIFANESRYKLDVGKAFTSVVGFYHNDNLLIR